MDLGIIEVVVNRRKNPMMGVARVLLIIVTVFLVLVWATLSSALGLILSIVVVLLAVAAGVGAYFIWLNTDVDYEYALVDRELRIAKIMNKEKRKKAGVYDLDKLEIMAPVNSHELDSFRNRPEMKEEDYSTHDPERAAMTYHVYLEGNRRLVLDLGGEDGQKLLNAIMSFAPRKIRRY